MTTNQGPALSRRVWRLFSRAGFATRPNATDATEEIVTLPGGKSRPVDLVAEDGILEVKIIGQNRSGADSGGSVSRQTADLAQLVRSAHAQAGLLVYTDRNIDPKSVTFAKKRRIAIWDTQMLEYFEEVTECIGHYAKYEILSSFGVSTKEEKAHLQFLSLRLKQPTMKKGKNLYLFTASPEFLLQTSVVLRRVRGAARNYQRMVSNKRLRSVSEFVARPQAILPTDIIVGLSDRVSALPLKPVNKTKSGRTITRADEDRAEFVILDIPRVYASLEIIDGQHRLFGFAKSTELLRKSFNLVVLGIEGTGDNDCKDMFIAINDRSRRVDANLVAHLKYTSNEAKCKQDPELMALKVVFKLNESGPFKQRIRLLDVGKEKLTLKGVAGYDLKGLLGKKGLLRKHNGNSSQKLVTALNHYFQAVKQEFKTEWDDPEKYIIATNKGITAFLKLLRSILRTEESAISYSKVHPYIVALKNHWSGSWETQKLRSSYVGSQGWKEFHRHMVTAIKNDFPDIKE